MMPNVDGLTVCRVLRAERNRLPILMLTARTETADRVAGLDAGADDYLAKPFELDELFARVRALLRRAKPDDDASEATTLQLGDLRIEPHARRVWRAGREIDLSKTEFDLLELLVRNRASCSTTRRSTSGSGATTSDRTPRTSRSTSPTCAASWRARVRTS